MSDLIDRKALLDIVENKYRDIVAGAYPFNIVAHDLFKIIKEQPTVEARQIVHGEWVDRMVRDWICSECGEEIKKVRNVDGYCYDDKPNFCPNCGANMTKKPVGKTDKLHHS